jgi:metal-responsive CopG/Arc/MetJ family transcriptional regulator
MRTTVVLDDDLLEEAGLLSNVRDRTSLLREALKALIERESAKRLVSLGGSEPKLNVILRRQSVA